MKLSLSLLAAAASAALTAPAVAGESGDDPHKRLVIGGDCQGCDFADSNLANAQFLGGDFSSADFSHAELLGARMADMTFSGADFAHTSLSEARLNAVSFSGADLSDADFQRARLHQVDFAGARLERTRFTGTVMMQVSFAGADLGRAEARDAVLRQVDFTSADMRGAQFSQAHFFGAALRAADLRSATLTGAIFEQADLTEADFRSADLTDARFVSVDLTGADFRSAHGLAADSFRQVCGARIDGLPDTVSIDTCGGETSPARVEDGKPALSAAYGGVDGRRRALQQARASIEAAIEEAERNLYGSAIEREALDAAREGLRAALASMAHADMAMESGGEAGAGWTFEIRRAELGEPIRVLLEQSGGGPPAPPSPPAAVEARDGAPGEVVVRFAPSPAPGEADRRAEAAERRAEDAERRAEARREERRGAPD
ncbi:MAG: pentapeptide repeat-containing protein [Oceanicaulis sp.]